MDPNTQAGNAATRRDDDEAALVQRAARGEEAAFTAIMRRHNQLLFRSVRSILKSDADAEDALQEAWLQAWRALGTFRADARLSTSSLEKILATCVVAVRGLIKSRSPISRLESPSAMRRNTSSSRGDRMLCDTGKRLAAGIGTATCADAGADRRPDRASSCSSSAQVVSCSMVAVCPSAQAAA